MTSFDHETYISPLTWRYGSPEMRRVWSEAHKRRLLRQFWVALAQAQLEAGLVTAEQVADLRSHQDDINIERAEAIERETRHDLMAEIRTYAEQCPVGGPILHLGATSMDALDNVDALRLGEALDLIIRALEDAIVRLADRVDAEAATACMAFTHIQPAEPTTIGYRLAQTGQDLVTDLDELRRVRERLRGKGLKGAVGTSASYTELLSGTDWSAARLEARVMELLGLRSFDVATQTYPRKQDWLIVNALAGLCATLHKFAFDLRLLQSPPFGEWSEPFGEKQVGSSAMPFKRNPIAAENVDSLTRVVAALPQVAWQNAALSLLERTLDDSANRRMMLPEAFLISDEALRRSSALMADLQLWPGPIERNLRDYGVFAATERLLMAGVKAGGDRQQLHEIIRGHSLSAWAALQAGLPNPLIDLMVADQRITSLVPAPEVVRLMDAHDHVGDAPQRARAMADRMRQSARQSTKRTQAERPAE
jgi:adenylosuccinate lyase